MSTDSQQLECLKHLRAREDATFFDTVVEMQKVVQFLIEYDASDLGFRTPIPDAPDRAIAMEQAHQTKRAADALERIADRLDNPTTRL